MTLSCVDKCFLDHCLKNYLECFSSNKDKNGFIANARERLLEEKGHFYYFNAEERRFIAEALDSLHYEMNLDKLAGLAIDHLIYKFRNNL